MTGTVTAIGARNGAGIGSGDGGADGGMVSIYGGTVTANSDGYYGAGIGGCNRSRGGDVMIYGGNITANGGIYSAGIGGGSVSTGGTVTIYDGTVMATGGQYAAGIGSGRNGVFDSVTINGGNVTAIGTDGGEGIGHGASNTQSVPLTVAEGIIVKGGSDADSLSVLKPPFETRYPYMRFLSPGLMPHVVASYREYDLNSEQFIEKTADCLVIDEFRKNLSTGWYIVDSQVTIPDRIEISGDVHLVLADGSKLTASCGIHIVGDNSLTIYGQSESTGELKARSPYSYSEDSGIGWNGDDADDKDMVSGPLTIHGGKIWVGGSRLSVAIGGAGNHGGPVTIYGGTVEAYGDASFSPSGIRGTVSIYGGTVKAFSLGGAGISGTVTIY